MAITSKLYEALRKRSIFPSGLEEIKEGNFVGHISAENDRSLLTQDAMVVVEGAEQVGTRRGAKGTVFSFKGDVAAKTVFDGKQWVVNFYFYSDTNASKFTRDDPEGKLKAMVTIVKPEPGETLIAKSEDLDSQNADISIKPLSAAVSEDSSVKVDVEEENTEQPGTEAVQEDTSISDALVEEENKVESAETIEGTADAGVISDAASVASEVEIEAQKDVPVEPQLESSVEAENSVKETEEIAQDKPIPEGEKETVGEISKPAEEVNESLAGESTGDVTSPVFGGSEKNESAEVSIGPKTSIGTSAPARSVVKPVAKKKAPTPYRPSYTPSQNSYSQNINGRGVNFMAESGFGELLSKFGSGAERLAPIGGQPAYPQQQSPRGLGIRGPATLRDLQQHNANNGVLVGYLTNTIPLTALRVSSVAKVQDGNKVVKAGVQKTSGFTKSDYESVYSLKLVEKAPKIVGWVIRQPLATRVSSEEIANADYVIPVRQEPGSYAMLLEPKQAYAWITDMYNGVIREAPETHPDAGQVTISLRKRDGKEDKFVASSTSVPKGRATLVRPKNFFPLSIPETLPVRANAGDELTLSVFGSFHTSNTSILQKVLAENSLAITKKDVTVPCKGRDDAGNETTVPVQIPLVTFADPSAGFKPSSVSAWYADVPANSPVVAKKQVQAHSTTAGKYVFRTISAKIGGRDVDENKTALSGSNPAYNDFVAAAGKPFGFEELSRFVGTTRKAKSGNKKTTLLVGAANIRGGSKILGQDFTQAAYSALLQDVIRFN